MGMSISLSAGVLVVEEYSQIFTGYVPIMYRGQLNYLRANSICVEIIPRISPSGDCQFEVEVSLMRRSYRGDSYLVRGRILLYIVHWRSHWSRIYRGNKPRVCMSSSYLFSKCINISVTHMVC